MLVRTKDDFQQLLRTPNDLQYSVFETQFAQVQNTTIANYFGMDFVIYLDERITAGSLTAEETFVIEQLKTAIVYLGADLASARLSVNIKSTGMEQTNKSLYEWQQLNLENDSLENGYNAIGAAISYLCANRDHTKFALWKDSTAEQNARKLLFNSTADFHASVNIANSTRTFEALKQSIKEALVKYIKPITGATLLAQITDANIDYTIANEKLQAMLLIREALAQYTMAIAIYKLELRFNEQGARVVSVSSTSAKSKVLTPADIETKDRVADRFMSTGEMYLEELKAFLIANNLIPASTYTDIDNSTGCVVL
jgi:hypothetical protein